MHRSGGFSEHERSLSGRPGGRFSGVEEKKAELDFIELAHE
jgi:hypothetical protein